MKGYISTPRLTVSVAILAGGIILLHTLVRPEQVPPYRPLSEFPTAIAGWHGNDLPLAPRIVEAAGVSEYLNRTYTYPADIPVQLYIGYYKSQRTGDTIHSPKNCLPGGGWEPLIARRIAFEPSAGRRLVINEYLIEKGPEKDLVLYWYQARGRVIASEYWAKVWLVVDALERNRTDGALVRIWTPAFGGETEARERAVNFARTIYPHLGEFIPN